MTATKNIHDDEGRADRNLKETFGNAEPFSVPEGYFESLTSRIMENVGQEEQSMTRSLFMKPMFRSIAATAAVVIVALVITFVFNSREESVEYADYTVKDVYEYNLSNLAELEEAYILSLFNEEERLGSFVPDTEFNDISEEALIDYLLAENHIEYFVINEY